MPQTSLLGLVFTRSVNTSAVHLPLLSSSCSSSPQVFLETFFGTNTPNRPQRTLLTPLSLSNRLFHGMVGVSIHSKRQHPLDKFWPITRHVASKRKTQAKEHSKNTSWVFIPFRTYQTRVFWGKPFFEPFNSPFLWGSLLSESNLTTPVSIQSIHLQLAKEWDLRTSSWASKTRWTTCATMKEGSFPQKRKMHTK